MSLTDQDKDAIQTLLKRDPSEVELAIFDTMWSEHCSYKSSKPVLKRLPTQASSVALGIGEDAGIIRFHQVGDISYCIAVSHESHNHPSQILPIEGAATGVGGCVRDVYCMGADVIGVLNSLHFGLPEKNGNALVEEIEEKVVQGVAGYGNPLGVPVLGGETLYHSSYNDNCLVNVAALGLVEESKIIHSYVPQAAKEEPYDMILVGKSTDATGFGGASFSSETLDEENEASNMGAVQVHDPFLKRVLVEAIKSCLRFIEKENVEIGFKDLGAGGISCAGSELAVAGGFGVHLRLEDVNVVNKSLPLEVIACSETQERFCLAVPRKLSSQICDIFNKEYAIPTLYPKAGAVVMGEVTAETQFVMTYNGNIVCDLPVESITTEVRAKRTAQQRPILTKCEDQISLKETYTLERVCLALLKTKMNASKRYVYRFFDNAVKGNTVIYPGEADAVVIKPIPNEDAGLAVSMDSNLYGEVDPYTCGASAVAESIRNIIAVGAKPLALTDCLNYGNPERPNVFFDFEQGVQGIADAANALSIDAGEPVPIISGNVSFYNESKQGNAVVPSPVICAMGKVAHIKQARTMQVTEQGLDLILIGQRFEEYAATQVQPYIEEGATVAPQVRLDLEAKQNNTVMALYDAGHIKQCHDISAGGGWLCCVEMLLGERANPFVGATLQLPDSLTLRSFLFSENGGYIIATHDAQACLEQANKQGVYAAHIGQTVGEHVISISAKDTAETINVKLPDLAQAWDAYNP